jgi:spore maturation protein CgeB
MRICLFYHSIISDWNHGNAHFLRGIVSALLQDNHQITIYEPLNGWSYSNMIADAGESALHGYRSRFPLHQVRFYNEKSFTPSVISDADLVIVHEWNSPEMIRKIGTHRKYFGNYVLLFHDTHHRAVTDYENMKKNDLSGYDGVLAFGETIRSLYIKNKWTKDAWTWHEAADTSIFHPQEPRPAPEGDLVWIGNWGDDERTRELFEFIINPVKELGLKAKFYGVQYPAKAIAALKSASIEYGGWLPNYRVPEVFAKYKLTVHVPRRPYVEKLPGIPTIRPFEALACGIPLISSHWNDTESLFRKNIDFLMVDNGDQMKAALKEVLNNKELSQSLASHGLETIKQKHTCVHRKNELLAIYNKLRLEQRIETAKNK